MPKINEEFDTCPFFNVSSAEMFALNCVYHLNSNAFVIRMGARNKQLK